MDRFEELLNLLRAGGDDLPDTIYDDLLGVHNEGMAPQECAECANKEAIIKDLKAKNYDLLIGGSKEVAKGEEEVKTGEEEEEKGEDEEEESDDPDSSINKLFTTEKKSDDKKDDED